jgi:hypothetical protein
MKAIKSIFQTSLILSLFILTEGCKKDEPAAPANPLIGSWKFVSYVASGCTNPTANETTTCSTSPSSCETMVFTSTQITFTQPSGASNSVSYTIKGSEIAVQGSAGNISLIYAVVGTTLTLSNNQNGCNIVRTYSKI